MTYRKLGWLLLLFIFTSTLSAQTQLQNMSNLVIQRPDSAYLIAKDSLRTATDANRKIFWGYYALESCLNLALYEESTEILHQLEGSWELADDSLRIMEAHRTIARILTIEGKYVLALQKFMKILDFHHRWNNVNLLCLTRVNLAEYYRIVQKFESGKRLLDEVLQLENSGKVSDEVLANALHRYAAIDMEQSKTPQTVIEYSKRSLAYSEPIRHYQHMATSYHELGFIYLNKEDERCLDYFKKALEIWKRIHHKHYEANEWVNIANYHINFGDLDSGLAAVEKALVICRKYKLHNLQYNALLLKSSALYAGQNYREAYAFLDSGIKSHIYTLNSQYNKEINALSQEFETEIAYEQLKNSEHQKQIAMQNAGNERMEKNRITIVLFAVALTTLMILYYNFRIRRQHIAIRQQKQIIESQNESLTLSIQEKDTLLQEVHHRVKNNLQIITALMEMQYERGRSDIEKELIKNLLSRISAMSLIHQQLYTQPNMDKLYVDEYTGELVDTIDQLSNAAHIPVRYDLKLVKVELDVSRCIALGMIITELVTNSLKYAFKGGQEPVIQIMMERGGEEGLMILTYNDSGPGYNSASTPGLGTRLIDMFSRQLKARHIHYTENTNKFELSFFVK